MIQDILDERKTTHGDFVDNSYLSQEIKNTLFETVGYNDLEPYMAEALDMIVHKIARIVCGDAKFKDHWDDIAGYATLVSHELSK